MTMSDKTDEESDGTDEDDQTHETGERLDDGSWIDRMKAKAEELALEAAGVPPEGQKDDTSRG